MYFKKYFIVINENKYDKIIDAIIKSENSKFPAFIKLLNPNIETAAKVGIDNKNEILAASYLLNLNILAPVMVIPDLLTPGINDNT